MMRSAWCVAALCVAACANDGASDPGADAAADVRRSPPEDAAAAQRQSDVPIEDPADADRRASPDGAVALESDAAAPLDPDAGEAIEATAAGLLAVAQSGRYLTWPAEPAVHASAGPHGRKVRTFVNPTLFDALQAGADEHPPGSVAVKELYGDGDAIEGYAVDFKNDVGWVFFEGFAPGFDDYFFRGTNNLCGRCHEGGTDYVLTPAAALR